MCKHLCITLKDKQTEDTVVDLLLAGSGLCSTYETCTSAIVLSALQLAALTGALPRGSSIRTDEQQQQRPNADRDSLMGPRTPTAHAATGCDMFLQRRGAAVWYLVGAPAPFSAAASAP